MTFPIELVVTTGQSFEIEHPDFTYLNPNTGDLWYFPKDGPIVVIDPAHIVKVLPRRARPRSEGALDVGRGLRTPPRP